MSECARPVLPAKAAAVDGGGRRCAAACGSVRRPAAAAEASDGKRRQAAACGGAGSRCLHCISGARACLAFLCMYDIGTAKVIHMN